jgi:diacylglycerol kinase family enzyme
MREGLDLVVALRGDGTVNEVVNGLLTDGVHPGVPALGVVPGGSTNVFARSLGLPNDPLEATGALLEALRTGRRRTVSLGRLDDRWFTFAAGVGLDAAIIAGVERYRRRGHPSTNALYLRVGLREMGRREHRSQSFTAELSDGSVLDQMRFAIVSNVDPWTYLGQRPLRPTPLASPDTGLDIYARRAMHLPGVTVALARMGRRRIPARDRGGWGATVRHDLDHITLRADIPLPIQVDGDVLTPRATMSIVSVPKALQVAAPMISGENSRFAG